jgi:hypothetical protein
MNCVRCKVYKSLSEFYKSNNKVGRRPECKECTKERKIITFNSRGVNGYIKKIYSDTNNRCKNTKGRIKNELKVNDIIDMYEKQEGRCALTGKKMTYERGKGRMYTNLSIDRIKSEKHYTKDNIQLVCNVVNTMKWDMTQEDFEYYCKLVTIHRKTNK